MKVLFVCTGNICRSPTAERLAAAYAARQGIEDLSASSAGTRAVIGHPIHPEAARRIAELGGNTGDFTARQLTARLAAEADLIIPLTTAHRDAVLELAPQTLHRTFTLGEVAELVAEHNARNVADLPALRPHLIPGDRDIADPIAQSRAVFSAISDQIAELVPAVLELFR